MREGTGRPLHASAFLIGGTSRFGGHPAQIHGEKLLVYLDDVSVICSPERVRAVFTIIGEEFARHAQDTPCTGVEPWRSHTTRC